MGAMSAIGGGAGGAAGSTASGAATGAAGASAAGAASSGVGASMLSALGQGLIAGGTGDVTQSPAVQQTLLNSQQNKKSNDATRGEIMLQALQNLQR